MPKALASSLMASAPCRCPVRRRRCCTSARTPHAATPSGRRRTCCRCSSRASCVPGRVMLRSRGELVVRRRTVAKSCGRGDHLERRSRRVGLRDRAVDQRLVGIGVELVPRLRGLGTVVAGKQVRVVARRADHRQDACRCSARWRRRNRCNPCWSAGRTPPAASTGSMRGDDVAAARIASGDQVEEALPNSRLSEPLRIGSSARSRPALRTASSRSR